MSYNEGGMKVCVFVCAKGVHIITRVSIHCREGLLKRNRETDRERGGNKIDSDEILVWQSG